MRRPFIVLTAVLCLLFAASVAWSQGTTSRVVGVVSDPSGAVVPNAKVTLTNEGTGVSFITTTTGAGTYVFEAVQVGRYTIAVEIQGFKKFTSTGNRVEIGQPATVNVTLAVGAVAESVSVSGAYEVVQTSSSGNFGGVVEQRVLADLPIVGTRGRNPLALVLTQPGVVAGANTGGGVHVHGARDRAWNYTLDGIDTNETSAGGSNFSPLRPNPDSLAEFRVITSNTTAEFGRNSGAQVTMITRSGTNDLHGSAFWFYRTPRFNANEWENNLNKVGKRQFVQHIPGFSVGGPIKKNRTFFFVNTQWLRTLETGTYTKSVYTADARKGTWRYVKGGRNRPFGASGASVDASGNPVPGLNIGTYSIPGNDPQRLGLDPEVQKFNDMMPLPNNFAVGDGLNTAGFTYVAPQREKQYDLVFKVDHAFSDRNFLYARIAWGRQDTLCDQVNGGEPRAPGLPCWVNTERMPRNLAFNWRWNPTPRITNELVVGGNHFTFNFNCPLADKSRYSYWSTPVDVPLDFEYCNARTINTYQWVENLSYAHGAHNFRMGANIRYQQHLDTRGSIAGLDAYPTLDFDRSVNVVDPATFNIPADLNVTFDRPALQNSVNYLLGRVGYLYQGFVAQKTGDAWAPGGTLFLFDARYPEYDFYWQDNWRARKNLTVDLGLRWEVKFTPRDAAGLIRRPNQAMVAGAPPSNTLRWEKGQLYNSDWNNLGPALGLAWDPTGKGKTSVRVNYRLAFDRINTFVLSSRIFQSIPGLTYGLTDSSFGQAAGRLRNLPKLDPPATVKPSGFLQPAPFSNSLMSVVDPNFRAPKTNMWGLSVQRELWNRMVFETTYIGRRGVGLFGAYDANQALYRNNGFLEAFNIVKAGGQSDLMNRLLAPDTRRGSTETGSDMVRRLFASSLDLNAVASLAKLFASRIQDGRSISDLAGLGPFFLVSYPQFTGAVRVIDSNDFSTYHALELKLERQFAAGYGFLVAYTLSKSLDTGSFDPAFTVVSTGAGQSASSSAYDIYNRRLNYALSDFDRTHVFQSNWLVELPFGRGKRFAKSLPGALDRIIGGWELAGFMTIQAGRPFTIYSGANTFSNLVQTPANCNGCKRSDGTVFDDSSAGYKFYLDATERGRFSTPAPGAMGNTGRNFFRGPGSFNMDVGIIKRTRIAERHSLEYRAEFTNLTNTPTFGFPTAGITSTTFGRIRDNVISGSRKIQMALKYAF